MRIIINNASLDFGQGARDKKEKWEYLQTFPPTGKKNIEDGKQEEREQGRALFQLSTSWHKLMGYLGLEKGSFMAFCKINSSLSAQRKT